MSRSAPKSTNKKGNILSKQLNEATADEVIVCGDNGDNTSGGEVVTVVNSLGKKIRVNWARKYSEKIKKAVSDWDNGTGNFVDENGMPFEKNRLNMKVFAEKLESPY